MTERIIKYSPSTYYNKAIIKEPNENNKSSRVIRLVVDSRERNISLFPNPNNYEINLLEDVQNVVHMSLITAEFPFDSYLINNNNNMLYLAYNDQVYPIIIETGNYTETELASELTTKLNNAIGSTDFVVEYVPRKDNFIFRCKNLFGLVFRGEAFNHAFNYSRDTAYPEKSIGRVIGFGINNYVSVSIASVDAFVHVVNSEFKKNFEKDDYIILKIDAAEINKSTSDSINNSFAVISRNKLTSVFEENAYHKNFKPPISKLPKLKFRLLDYYGNLYDFQNKDHKLELMLVCDF